MNALHVESATIADHELKKIKKQSLHTSTFGQIKYELNAHKSAYSDAK